MGHYVVLSTIYLGKPSANGICAQNIVKALQEAGNIVDVICYENSDIKEKNVYTVPGINIEGSGSLIGKMMNLSKLIFPKFDNVLVENYYQQLITINDKEKIDCIVAMYFPFESVEATYRFKKKYDDVTAITYELDSVGDGIAKSGIQGIITKAYERWLRKIYAGVDSIFVMKSHKQYWDVVFGTRYKTKCQVADIPVFTRKELAENPSITRNMTKMIYAGLIEKKYRSPSYLLESLKLIKRIQDFEMSFFSKGDCEQEIQEAAIEIGSIKQNGYVLPEVLETAIQESDFLISIGNSVSRSVPSKIITYLSYGKPIIHFSSQKDDVCNEYLKEYDLALVVDQSSPVEQSAKLISDFIKENKGRTLTFETIREKLVLNDPTYSAEVILDVVSKKSNVGRLE